jgi:hypothetical protein
MKYNATVSQTVAASSLRLALHTALHSNAGIRSLVAELIALPAQAARSSWR